MTEQEIIDNAPEIKNNAGALLYYSPESDRYYEEHDGYWYEVDDYTMTKIVAPTAFIRSLADIKRIVELEYYNVGLADESCQQQRRIAYLEKEQLDSDLLVMSNARRLIKAKARTSNGRLYSELFGTGMGTGLERCRKLGLDPDSNKTDYHATIKALKDQVK